MKCLLCKGKGSFLVHKENNQYDPLMMNKDYYENEICPRCKGRKYEKTIGLLNKRASEIFRTYSEHYSKYFKEEIPLHHKEILEKI